MSRKMWMRLLVRPFCEFDITFFLLFFALQEKGTEQNKSGVDIVFEMCLFCLQASDISTEHKPSHSRSPKLLLLSILWRRFVQTVLAQLELLSPVHLWSLQVFTLKAPLLLHLLQIPQLQARLR